MELQEDAFRLQQVLPDRTYGEIIEFLRTKVPFSDTEIRCRVALQFFLKLEKKMLESSPNYENDYKADFLCVKHVLNSVPDEEIWTMLECLGPIPNRKHVAAKILLHQTNPNYRKRKNAYEKNEELSEPSSSKLVKVADSTEPIEPLVQPAPKGSKIPKLLLKKDRNSNEFMVTPELRTASTNPDEYVPGTSHLPVSNGTKTINANLRSTSPVSSGTKKIHANAFWEIPTTTFKPYNEAAGTSKMFDNKKAGPSTRSDQSSMDYDNRAESVNDSIEETILTDSDDPIIDLRSTTNLDEPTNEAEVSAESVEVLDEEIVIDEKLFLKLIEMFPDAAPDYIRNLCKGKTWCDHTFASIIDIILTTEDYPRRPERLPSPDKEVDPEEQLNTLKSLLPDADPTYLQEKLNQLAGDQEGLMKFIEDAVDNKKYPTMKEYLRRQQLSAQQRQCTTDFNIERFVELFPDPVTIFEDRNRKTTILTPQDKSYVKYFMRNLYSQLYVKDINSIVDSNAAINVVSIINNLEKRVSKGMVKKTRIFTAMTAIDSSNIPLLHELAYFRHKKDILQHIETKKKRLAQERADAKELGLLQTCNCCFDEEIMPTDILTCEGGCRFCKECIQRSTEVAFGDGKLNFPCLSGNCEAQFSLPVLQSVLAPKLFSKLAQKKAVAEVKAAGVEDLETCPFCDFANIPAPEDKLFRCLNPDCMKESCRQCKEPSHVPLRCEEVEKDEAVKARTYIENKMTEALVRECWKCGAKFIKDEGCNKMTCSCGASMCYICRQPVKDYKHFNGQGGDQYQLCPLYSDNFTVNEKNVLQAAVDAKKEVDPTQLKNDPTADIQKHYHHKIKEAKKKELERQNRLRHALVNHPHVHGHIHQAGDVGRFLPLGYYRNADEVMRAIHHIRNPVVLPPRLVPLNAPQNLARDRGHRRDHPRNPHIELQPGQIFGRPNMHHVAVRVFRPGMEEPNPVQPNRLER